MAPNPIYMAAQEGAQRFEKNRSEELKDYIAARQDRIRYDWTKEAIKERYKDDGFATKAMRERALELLKRQYAAALDEDAKLKEVVKHEVREMKVKRYDTAIEGEILTAIEGEILSRLDEKAKAGLNKKAVLLAHEVQQKVRKEFFGFVDAKTEKAQAEKDLLKAARKAAKDMKVDKKDMDDVLKEVKHMGINIRRSNSPSSRASLTVDWDKAVAIVDANPQALPPVAAVGDNPTLPALPVNRTIKI